MRALAVAAVVLLAPVALAAGQSTTAPEIVAQGQAVVSKPADQAWVTVAVEARAAAPESARRDAAAAMTSVMTTLKPLVAADAIKTSAFSIGPEMEYPNGSPKLKDYVARNQISVRVDELDELPRVLDASAASGATSIAGLRFDVKDRVRWEHEALASAVRDAMARAQAMAAGAGKSLGAIVRIEEQPIAPPAPMMSFAAARSSASPETPIAAGNVDIRAEVTVTVGLQ